MGIESSPIDQKEVEGFNHAGQNFWQPTAQGGGRTLAGGKF